MFRHLMRHLQGKLACWQLMLDGLIADLKMYFTWVYNVIYNWLSTMLVSM
jgi:hypothetical protein